MPRATVSDHGSGASANKAAPPADTSSSAVCTRRGPNRSSRRPSGSWNKVKPNK
jgi:hypothetical protein